MDITKQRRPISPKAAMMYANNLKKGGYRSSYEDIKEVERQRKALEYRTKYISRVQPGQVWKIQQRNNPEKWLKGETDKSRPMLIISRHGNSVHAVPLTTKENAKKHCKNIYEMSDGGFALVEQTKFIPIDLLCYYIRDEKPEILKEIRRIVAKILTDPDENYTHVNEIVDSNSSDIPIIFKSNEFDLNGKKIPGALVNQILNTWDSKPMQDILKTFKGFNKSEIFYIVDNCMGRNN